MPIVEKSGVYRSADGHAYFLRRGRIVDSEIADAYELDADAELSEEQAEIVALEADAESPSLGREVVAAETSTTLYPSPLREEVAGQVVRSVAIEPEVESDDAEVEDAPDAPAPVKPGKRARKRAEDRAERAIETPENKSAPIDNRIGPNFGKPMLNDSDGDGESDADEAEDSDA